METKNDFGERRGKILHRLVEKITQGEGDKGKRQSVNWLVENVALKRKSVERGGKFVYM